MKIKGITREQIEMCAKRAYVDFELRNVRSEGRYTLFVLRMATGLDPECGNKIDGVGGHRCTRPRGHEGKHWKRTNPRVIAAKWEQNEGTPNDGPGSPKYRKRGHGHTAWGTGPEYAQGAVCFHGHWRFMAEVFKVNHEAIIRTAKSSYLGWEDFKVKARRVEDSNVGSVAVPISYGDACDCEEHPEDDYPVTFGTLNPPATPVGKAVLSNTDKAFKEAGVIK